MIHNVSATHPATRAPTRSVTRLEIAVEEDYEQFRERYEQAVPPLDYQRTFDLIAHRARWSAVLDLAEDNGPLGFMIYWKFDAQPLFGLAGDHARCTEYLMGNHTIAERMYRHDAGALLYAPLRTTIHESPSGETVFAIDRPSDTVAALGRSEISEVGRELDRKVGTLLRHLGAPVPVELT
ncbi:hypothetical protein AB0D38_20805 [Streptomyces sp. NPDC048279]|uniref:hypothetical protein n=1 Tax=Streptomyces sp. NPDC048279 TaxID=3154714 RepID=UPI003440DFDF